MLQAQDDPNLAYDDGEDGLFRTFKTLPTFELIHRYVGSMQEIRDILDSLAPRKIAHLIIQAHGNARKMHFGKIFRAEVQGAEPTTYGRVSRKGGEKIKGRILRYHLDPTSDF